MTRALSGHLEDLGLDEVVRVIGLSKKSGMLTVEALEGRAELLFAQGRVVRARHTDTADTVADVLVRANLLKDEDLVGIADAVTLDELVSAVERHSGDRALLVRVDDVLAEHLTNVVARASLWKSGSFQFLVSDDESPPLRFPRDTSFTLPTGIDADELSREARRRRAERRADPLSPFSGRGSQLPHQAEAVDVYIVDDDRGFLSFVEREVVASGLHTATAFGARQGLERLATLPQSHTAMIVDLVMPRSDGRGILGGLEVLRRAQSLGVVERVFLALDGDHDDAAVVARELGAAGIVRRPKSLEPKNGEPVLSAYLNPVLELLGRAPLVGAAYDLARELRSELNAELGTNDTAEGGEWRTDGARITDEGVRSLETLKGLLGELNDPSFDEEIPLLVLRFASAFFGRGALFNVDPHKGEITGVGGFGLGGPDPGRLVHAIKIPLHADTVFVRALKEKAGVRQPFWDSEWNMRLSSSLGGPRPRDVYTAPLMSPRGVEALLYADNATDPRPFPDMHLLEIFLQQSAAAIERSMLVREVKSLRPPR